MCSAFECGVVLVDDDTVDAIFDIKPDPSGNGLHFVFPLPKLVSRDDVREFTTWLASPSYAGQMVH